MKKDDLLNNITPSEYKTWALARRGTKNPQDMTNPVWTWMLNDKIGAYKANQNLDKNHKHHPGWSYYRYGQTETFLPDGTKILIAGEHEDSYDPDFFIYNDVTVIRPNGDIKFYGYSEYWFPPTDNHSAILVDDQIYIIGCLGYPHQRHKDITPVYRLDTTDFSIRKVRTQGKPPNWLHGHDAYLSKDKKFIICENGIIIHPSGEYVESLATWQLELETNMWKKLSEKKWTRWIIHREDYSINDLWDIDQLNYSKRTGRKCSISEKLIEDVKNRNHRIDLELYKRRRLPPFPHAIIGEDEDNFRHFRVSLNGIMLRIIESSYDISFNVEGELPDDIIESLQIYYLDIYSKLEGLPYKIKTIE